MHIEIAERIRPFTHVPGAYIVLPGSVLRLRVFPTLIEVDDLSQFTPNQLCKIRLAFGVEGPFDEFTIQQDLEKGNISVWAKSGKNLFRYNITALKDSVGISLLFEKLPASSVELDCSGEWAIAYKGKVVGVREKIVIGKPSQSIEIPHIDRLSLGNHKSQDWELIRRRGDFSEIFPIWHRLGQFIEKTSACESYENGSLVDECQKAIEANAPENILKAFNRLFLTGFEGALSPRLIDTDYHGIAKPSLTKSNHLSPLLLLQQGAVLIRSLFVQEKREAIHLLPALPPEFHSGRLLNVRCGKGLLSIEWTKKSIRRVYFQALETGDQKFTFSSHEKSFMLRTSTNKRGIRISSKDSLLLEKSENYWFDNFER